MLFGKDSFRKKNSGKYVIGYEFGQKYVQMSYLKVGEKEARTITIKQGEEDYNIPFVLLKREDTDLWYVGKEAVDNYRKGNGILLTDLLENAYQGKVTEVNLESYDACALLALYVKRSFAYLKKQVPMEQIAGIMFSVEKLDEKMVDTLRKMTEFLQLPQVTIQFIGKEESFFYYNLHTDPALWTNQVYLYELQGQQLKSYGLSLNRQTRPIVTLIEKKQYGEFPVSAMNRKGLADEVNLTEEILQEVYPRVQEDKELWDELFLEYLTEDMAEKVVSAVYLIGDGFLGEWYQKSVRFLCSKRRVFLGNNLYSKGACYALWDKLEPGELSASYVYLGADKLQANVGMELLRQGTPSYLAVLDGGSSWYDCKKEWDLILEDENSITFKITPLNRKNIRQAEIVLKGLPCGKKQLTRIHVEAYLEKKNEMKVKIWDKGFGEFCTSTGQYWEETIIL